MRKSNNLKFYRLNKNFSQKQVANYLNVPTGTYGNWEQGTREADYHSLMLLSKLYEVSINQLLGEKEENLIILSKEQYDQLVQAYDLMTKVMKNIRKPTSIQIKNQVIIGDNNSNNNYNINNG